MSGIVGSRLNIRGSGIVGSLGTDGQVLTSSGVGTSAVFEDAGGFAVGDITGATALAEEPALTDEIVISDGGVLKRLDIQHLLGVPFIHCRKDASMTATTSTQVKVPWNVEDKSAAGTFDSTNNRWTPGVAGHYCCVTSLRYPSAAMYDGRSAEVKVTIAGGLNQGSAQAGTNLYARGDAGGGWNGGFQYDATTVNAIDPRSFLVFWMDDDHYIENYAWQYTGSDFTVESNYSSMFAWRLAGMGTAYDSTLPNSDIRLKEDIELVGKSPEGINIYSFKYKDKEGRYEGVMAQEVPWASKITNSGYYAVDYSKVDVDFKKLKEKT